MLIARLSSGDVVEYPVDVYEAYPQISFPSVLSEECLPSDCVVVQPTDRPADGRFQVINEESPTFNGTAWVQVWTQTDMTSDQANAVTAGAWGGLRAERDALLSACDYTQLPDSPANSTVKAAWATYRQALRDLPGNIADPFSATFPDPPA